MGLQAVFFDAGNTLVFPDPAKTLAPLAARGMVVADDHLFAAERAARHYRDAHPNPSPNTDFEYWHTYARELVGHDVEDDLIKEMIAAAQKSSHWTVVAPGTRDVLLRLKRRFKVGLISNSDGGIGQLMTNVGLGDCFDSVTDSTHVGYQKPHPEIFQAALHSLFVDAHDSVYIGDIYSIDYLGAQAVGMKAILMDVFGTYTRNGLVRVSNLGDLEPLLNQMET
jgi:putative hydrolase of the HAD superfamily